MKIDEDDDGDDDDGDDDDDYYYYYENEDYDDDEDEDDDDDEDEDDDDADDDDDEHVDETKVSFFSFSFPTHRMFEKWQQSQAFQRPGTMFYVYINHILYIYYTHMLLHVVLCCCHLLSKIQTTRNYCCVLCFLSVKAIWPVQTQLQLYHL